MILGWDLAPRAVGWCAGSGADEPVADAFLPDYDAHGQLGRVFADTVERICQRFSPTHFVIEESLLLPHDKMDTLQRVYGMRMLLLTYADRNGVVVKMEPPGALKLELAGHRKADKADMVHAARRMGVNLLPKNMANGLGDAADAVAAWKIGIRLFARQHLARWDSALYSGRNFLV